jgi:hypothetical protein
MGKNHTKIKEMFIISAPNRWAIKESGDATFFSLVTGKPIVTLRTLKSATLSTSGETTYSRGGRGNVKIVGFSGNKESRLELVDAIFDNQAIGMLTGNSVTSGVKNIDYISEVTITTNAATLPKTPVGNLTAVYRINPDGTNGLELTKKVTTLATGEYDITAKAMTFFAGDSPNDTRIRVYYKVATDITSKNMRVTSDAFGGTFKITLDVLVRDEFTKADYAGIITIPNGKFEDNFELSLSSESEPAVLNLPVELLKNPSGNEMWELQIYDDALIS